MWRTWPNIAVAPLTELTYINRTFKRTKFEQDAFEKNKRVVARDISLTYSSLNEIFKVRTDAIAFQLGEAIIHKGKPIAFYSRNINDTQQRYTVTER